METDVGGNFYDPRGSEFRTLAKGIWLWFQRDVTHRNKGSSLILEFPGIPPSVPRQTLSARFARGSTVRVMFHHLRVDASMRGSRGGSFYLQIDTLARVSRQREYERLHECVGG